jgi:hypothetical protein
LACVVAGIPNVVRVIAVMQGVKGSMRLGITMDDQIVVVVREVVQCARGVHKSSACHALAGEHSADLARALGIKSGLDTA